MRILGIIPARGGSKGIKNKNLRKINGIPLIGHTILQSKFSKLLSKVIVSTDCTRIASYARTLDAEVPFLRPKEISQDNSPSILFVKHAIEFYKERNENYEAVCLLQPTSPFRPKGIIDDAILKYFNSNVESLVSLRRIPDHYNPYWAYHSHDDLIYTKLIESRDYYRRQDLPDTYHRDGAIYISSVNFILNNNILLSKVNTGYVISSPELINIDSHKDLKLCKKYLKELNYYLI